MLEAKKRDVKLSPEVDAYLGLAHLKLNREGQAKEYAQKALKARVVEKILPKDLKLFSKLFKLVEGYEAYLTPSGQ